MRICVIGKYPPIEGGVSTQTYWTCHMLGRAGHNVYVVTNADETELEHREWFLPGDAGRLNADYPSGGGVRVSVTQARHDEDLYYIPDGQPTVTRLVSVALEVVRRYQCDLLIGWYFEPYLIATSLVAAWTRRPYLIRHAGSDLQELAAQPELGPAYREAIRGAAGVLSPVLPAEGLGLPAEAVFHLPGIFFPAEFSAAGAVMDLIATARLLRGRGCASVLRTEPLPPGTALIGSYGKLGVSKGTVDLVWAVARARATGHNIGLALAGGGPGWTTVIEALHAAGLAEVTVTLPMLAPWRIPSFIRACQAVAFLERDFEVPQHRPLPPAEILACGRPLLLSTDVASGALPGREAGDPVFDAVETVDPRDRGALTAAVVSVLSRRKPTPDQIAASLRDEADVAAWYVSAFHRALGQRPAPADRDASAATVSGAERVLAQHCPALVRALGPRLAQHLPAASTTAPNALMAAYAAADSSLPDVLAMLGGADGAADRLAQLALAEHHALWSRVDVEGLAGIPAFAVPVQRVPVLPAEPGQLAALFPVASSWLKIAQFDVDAFAHLGAVASGRATDPLDRGGGPPGGQGQVLLFHKAPNLNHTISRISPAVRALLQAADGTRSLREHARSLHAEGDRLASLLLTVRELHRAGIVLFRRDPLTI